MSRWTYPVIHPTNGALLTEHLPIRCESFDDGLGVAVGSLAGELPLSAVDDVEDALLLWRRVIVPCKDGTPHGAYIITGHTSYGPRSATAGFVARRADARFDRTEIETDLDFTGADQFDMARAVMRVALDNPRLPGPRAPRWFQLDPGLSGVRRTMAISGADHPLVSDTLDDLGDLPDGFEYRLGYGIDPMTGLPAVTAELAHRHGSSSPVLPLQYPGNVVDWSYAADTDTTETYSRQYGKGATSDAVIDRQALVEQWPVLMGSHDAADVTDKAELDRMAAVSLQRAKGPREGWAVVLRGDALGTYEIGGAVALHVVDRRWPLGKRADLRITGHKVAPARQGRAERITLMVETV